MMFQRLLIGAAVSVSLAACTGGATDPLASVSESAAVASDKLLEGRYIVMLAPGETPVLERLGSLLNTLGGGTALMSLPIINGALVSLTEAQAALLETLPGVLHIEQDQIMTTSTVTQSNATWGLDRSDQRNLPLNQIYNYPAQAGAGVNVYILDTGINITHVDFGGRVVGGQNFASSSPLDAFPIPLPLPIDLGGLLGGLFGGGVDPNDYDDCNGHGTHVAGTAAGNTWGIAKSANLYAVRVLGCGGSGSNAGVIAGVQWVADNHIKPAVANMSLGGGNSDALDAAVREAVNRGVTMVVAAGNDNANACSGSPNRVAEAITVGSTDNLDRRSSFSNFGPCNDIFAPGSNIVSATHSNDTGSTTLSGTSMAAPHVAGAAALVLGTNPTASPAAVTAAVLGDATPGVISNVGTGSPNLLLYVGE